MSSGFRCLLLATLLGAPALGAAPLEARAADEARLKREAIERLAASHDPAIPIGVGRVYIKQTGLLQARALIEERGRRAGLGAEWVPGVPEWQAAEAHLVAVVDTTIAAELEDPAWFRAAWGAVAAQVLSAEEADEIATHFATEGGRQQRAVLELLLVGETLVANYTFTNRIRYDVPGSEREMELLQKTWWVSDHRRVYDFTSYPNAVRFASQDPGVKYSKMLAIQGIDALNRHFDVVVARVRARLLAEQSAIDAQVANYARRNAQVR